MAPKRRLLSGSCLSEGDLAAQGGWVPGSSAMRGYGRGNQVERSHSAFRKMFGDA
jgi:hypothetical protein